MVDIKVLKSEFIYSVPELSLMQDLGDELCFIGRSNVGKSSLINALCQKKDLARTSKLPGRTRHAVCYDVLYASADEKKPCIFVDLPGFGYASMSKSDAKACEALIFSYLEQRFNLRLVVLLLDIRRTPDNREKQIVSIARARCIDVMVVLTKCDKIALSKRKMTMNKIAIELGIDKEALELHSTHEQQFTEDLKSVIFSKLNA
jgi:GTP-binding protein